MSLICGPVKLSQYSRAQTIPFQQGNLRDLLQGAETEVGMHCSLLIQKDFRRNSSVYVIL